MIIVAIVDIVVLLLCHLFVLEESVVSLPVDILLRSPSSFANYLLFFVVCSVGGAVNLNLNLIRLFANLLEFI